MAILVNRYSRVILQGGDDGSGPGCSAAWRAGGSAGRSRFLAGVAYGHPAEHLPDGLPLFDSVRHAKAWAAATVSVVCMPPALAADAIEEAVDAGIGLVLCLTEGVPPEDLQRVQRRLNESATRLLGGCIGLVTPGEIHIGAIPGHALRRGRIGVVSRSPTLISLAASQLTGFGLGASTVIALGNAAADVAGLRPVDLLRLFKADPGTDAVLLAGSLGAEADEECAHWIGHHMHKPVVMFRHGPGASPRGVQLTRDPGAMGALIAAAVEPQCLPFD
ncbi:succinate--CoA ligase subunit alpha [Azohydromonas caseinilytica]|uniref:Succinate--CoA ligase subunit alpha n=1 Tax=Azohydromonas caseinilytica TaxID=2728836 RepID=A0A848FER1_9BURK|nr:succinate--CoA ligase subunit alpha [Azohydromonas caseinilytica]NML17884.1 succinate--CoA ligase subunit alpha [Azohydromonas caseinilytica]